LTVNLLVVNTHSPSPPFARQIPGVWRAHAEVRYYPGDQHPRGATA